MTLQANKQPRLVLGTAQLGLDYGAANRTGLPDEAQAIHILKSAMASRIETIDTARAYGDAERRIGLALPPPMQVEIVTKLEPLDSITATASPATAVSLARQSLRFSRAALGRDRLDALLLHRPGHRLAWQGAIWTHLKSERDAGGIGRIGVSVQTPGEAKAALTDPGVAQLQLPFNLLDGRWQASGVIDAIRQRPDVIVHVRSVFLQGLLAAGHSARWPDLPGLDPATLMQSLQRLAAELGRESVADLALAFVRAQDWIDGIVIGMETYAQLALNLHLFSRSVLTPSELAQVAAQTPKAPDAFLDPPNWRNAALNPLGR
jgi:spore coat polysaccharide biosynthesis protein SpsF